MAWQWAVGCRSITSGSCASPGASSATYLNRHNGRHCATRNPPCGYTGNHYSSKGLIMSQELVLDGRLESAKTTAWWLYIVHAVSFLFSLGLFSVIPLALNYLQRPTTEGTFVYSHHS